MTDAALRDQVIERLLAESDSKLTAGDVNDATLLRQDLDISSLMLVALAAELEDVLRIDLDNDELSRIQTIGQLLKAIENGQRRTQSV